MCYLSSNKNRIFAAHLLCHNRKQTKTKFMNFFNTLFKNLGKTNTFNIKSFSHVMYVNNIFEGGGNEHLITVKYLSYEIAKSFYFANIFR